jgi:hypothetical protein
MRVMLKMGNRVEIFSAMPMTRNGSRHSESQAGGDHL